MTHNSFSCRVVVDSQTESAQSSFTLCNLKDSSEYYMWRRNNECRIYLAENFIMSSTHGVLGKHSCIKSLNEVISHEISNQRRGQKRLKSKASRGTLSDQTIQRVRERNVYGLCVCVFFFFLKKIVTERCLLCLLKVHSK